MSRSDPDEPDLDELIERMTLAEKVGQCCGTYVGTLDRTQTVADVASLLDSHHLGSVSPFGTAASPHVAARDVAEVANRLQRHAVEETRLGIPLFVPVDAVHGHAYVDGATVFPNNLGLAAAWDPDLAERVARVTATEVAATGANVNYSPTCDVARDPRWGRTFETFGESPRLVGELAAAKVRGYQGSDDRNSALGDAGTVAATAKHFPAYGQPEGGEDAAPVEISSSTFYRDFLPSFEAALDAGAATVIPCYNAVDGEPAHGSARYLRRLLGDELGFDGPVASDWNGIRMLHEDHRVTSSLRESTALAALAGVGLMSIGGESHAEALLEAVEMGVVDGATIDEHVRRTLRLKRRLGLFEDPYVDPDEAVSTLGRDEHRELAYEAARSSLTLLQNQGALPFSPDVDDVLVTGPNADSLRNQFGGWSVFEADDSPGVTVHDGIEAAVGDDTTVTRVPGSGVRAAVDGAGGVDDARAAATDADAAVVVLGEDWYIHEFGPRAIVGSETGEFPTRTRLELPDAQSDLLRAVVDTGTPTALVLVTGRPLAVPWAAEHAPSILLSYYPGTEGGRAVADVLFGAAGPGGRLPILMPRSAGHLPTRFNHLRHPHPIGDDEHAPTYDPLFAFGHGESYTEFAYDDLTVDVEGVAPTDSVDRNADAGSVDVTVTVENIGDRAGDEVVQVYLTDEVSLRVTPVRELVGFERLRLDPGESASVSVSIPASALAVVGPTGERTIESGAFTVECGGQTAGFDVR